MKQKIVIGIFIVLFVANALVSFAGGHFPPNGKKCEVAGKVIYVDKTCMTNLDWREMQWHFKNKPEIFAGSVSETIIDSAVWKSVNGDDWKKIDNYIRIDESPVVGFSLKQCKIYADYRAAAVMDLYNNYSKNEQYKGVKLEYFMLSSEQYAELLKQKWFAKSFVDGYAEITSDGKFVKDGKIVDSVDDDKVTFRMYAVIENN
ncbi:MAG: hypothetical protein IKO34_02970 [Bacteroidales bacterium]|nr:hypothetical protein [Bacteroidales bacterium]MBR4582754.1 hypothetical protein [Bacteroidales bacterium]